jgi:hypothetical protein
MNCTSGRIQTRSSSQVPSNTRCGYLSYEYRYFLIRLQIIVSTLFALLDWTLTVSSHATGGSGVHGTLPGPKRLPDSMGWQSLRGKYPGFVLQVSYFPRRPVLHSCHGPSFIIPCDTQITLGLTMPEEPHLLENRTQGCISIVAAARFPSTSTGISRKQWLNVCGHPLYSTTPHKPFWCIR